jgi:hypothetical protein
MATYDKTPRQREKAHDFYREMLDLLNESAVPYLLSGAFALYEYTGLKRPTKDIDIFCRPEHYPSLLQFFEEKGYRIELTDERWLAKVIKGQDFMDIIWSTASGVYSVDDEWFENARKSKALERKTLIMGAEEMIFSKLFVRNRERYDGADINHILLRHGSEIQWELLMKHCHHHWQLLLVQMLEFLFVYPEGRGIVPQWVFSELMERATATFEMPIPVTKACRGPLIDHTQYLTDINEWGYKAVTLFSI